MKRTVDQSALKVNQTFIIGLLLLAYLLDAIWLLCLLSTQSPGRTWLRPQPASLIAAHKARRMIVMFWERLMIMGLLTLAATGAFLLFKQGQLRQINFKALAVAGGQPTLLYFRSDSCGTCPTQSRYLDQLMAGENGRFTIQSIDVDTEPDTAKQYGVMTLPTTMILDANGRVQEINYGLTPPHKLEQQISLVV
ncbi:MAG: conjugal transfer protein TraF [Aquificales bacterium]|nr:conjugal transfer protein TraF [Aquificales bacterium]